MRFSFIFTAALVTIVDAELAMLKELKDLGLDGIKDLSCFKQVWNSDQPDKDCPTKEDKAGGNCVWCDGASMGKMFAKTGACVNSEQTSFLEKKGMSCGTEAKLATKDDNDESIMDVLVKFGFDDTPDISCMKQVWKDETANTDCGTKKDASGGPCVW